MTTLIVDNYDSFAWNLFQLFGALGGEPRVVRNDAVTLDDVRRLAPRRIVLSPGPGRPDDPERVGVCRAILDADLGVPVLGVCLGHQAIVCAAGGRVVRAARPMHGKTSLVEHRGDGILHELPQPFEAMRYHSLTADPTSLPESLAVTAWCKDGTVMAVRHQRRPIFGVQFHPESIGTAWGPALCRSFLRGDYA
ncbi:MAG: aminodeoxychorismate/anthranilate synthase component II [Labilithrix sp.]|nr:aminodeoxychorismate/anthranilate synthase component II [Labilithrix sp.]MBX3223046.1 aminodeoxychorismate/anthranilate synthase component II [Labilithrix sp.]